MDGTFIPQLKRGNIMKLLEEAKANLTDEVIDVVLKSETDDKEYDVGYYFGVKAVIENEEIKDALACISYMVGEVEEKHYAEHYDVENPNDIPTEELQEHVYKYIRILVDNFGV